MIKVLVLILDFLLKRLFIYIFIFLRYTSILQYNFMGN